MHLPTIRKSRLAVAAAVMLGAAVVCAGFL